MNITYITPNPSENILIHPLASHKSHFSKNKLLDKTTPQDFLTTSFMMEDTHLQHDIHAINNGLASYFFILSVIEDALNDFIYKQYRSFDTLIGNNSCYISSYIIFTIAQKYINNETFKKRIQTKIKEIKKAKEKILSETKYFTKKIHSPSLHEFLQIQELIIPLDADCIYLSMAYGCTLSKIKTENEIEETCYKKLTDIYTKKLRIVVGKKSVQKLVKYWQKKLSIFNINTLQSHATDLSSENEKLWARYIVNDQYILKDQRERLCSSSLYTAVFIYNKLKKIPGVIFGLQVNLIQQPKQYISRFVLYFQVQENEKLKIVDQEEIQSIQPIYMLSGCRYIPSDSKINIEKIKEEFSSRNLRDLILAHEVTYPQYPKSLHAPDITPQERSIVEEIESYKKLEGFSLTNPTDLCLVHIFVDNSLNQSLATYEPPIYLPQLNDHHDRDKTCS